MLLIVVQIFLIKFVSQTHYIYDRCLLSAHVLSMSAILDFFIGFFRVAFNHNVTLDVQINVLNATSFWNWTNVANY